MRVSYIPTLDISSIMPKPKKVIATTKVPLKPDQEVSSKSKLRISPQTISTDTSFIRPQNTTPSQGLQPHLKILHAPEDSDNQKTIYLDETQVRKLMGIEKFTDVQILKFANQVASDLGFESQSRPKNPYIKSVMEIYNSEFIQENQFISGHEIDLDKEFTNILGVFLRHNKFKNAELLVELYKKIHPNGFSDKQKKEIFSMFSKSFYGIEQLQTDKLDDLNVFESFKNLIDEKRKFFINLKNQFIRFAELFGGLDELAKFADPQELTSVDKKLIIEQEYKLLRLMPDNQRPAFETFFKQISGISEQDRTFLQQENEELQDFLLGFNDTLLRSLKENPGLKGLDNE